MWWISAAPHWVIQPRHTRSDIDRHGQQDAVPVLILGRLHADLDTWSPSRHGHIERYLAAERLELACQLPIDPDPEPSWRHLVESQRHPEHRLPQHLALHRDDAQVLPRERLGNGVASLLGAEPASVLPDEARATQGTNRATNMHGFIAGVGQGDGVPAGREPLWWQLLVGVLELDVIGDPDVERDQDGGFLFRSEPDIGLEQIEWCASEDLHDNRPTTIGGSDTETDAGGGGLQQVAAVAWAVATAVAGASALSGTRERFSAMLASGEPLLATRLAAYL